MTFVKVCGITNLPDARLALDAGAVLLGFNFYPPSPRYVAPGIAAQIIGSLRAEPGWSFQAVGVFVNASLYEIRAIQAECALDLLQLHGDESLEFCRALGRRAFKVLRPVSRRDARTHLDHFAALDGQLASAPRFLIDATHDSLYGGTGARADWSLAAEIAAAYPILLAGGLTALNVGAAVRAVRPWGVDVASGIERAPGLKDDDKLRAFIRAAKTEL